jgi:hippurate hydrolase
MLAASAFCLQAQAVLSRTVNPFDPVVFSVGQITGGTSDSVIPAEVMVEGTLRAVSGAGRDTARVALERVGRAVAEMYGVTVGLERSAVYEPTRNDAAAADHVLGLARAALPAVSILEHPVMAAEDFGAILERIPGAMMLLGTRVSEQVAPNHSPRLLIDEPSLEHGTALLALLGLAR